MRSTRYSCRNLIKLEFSRQIFEETSNVKFHQNSSSGSRVASCGQTDMTKLIVAFPIPRTRLITEYKIYMSLKSINCTSRSIVLRSVKGWWDRWEKSHCEWGKKCVQTTDWEILWLRHKWKNVNRRLYVEDINFIAMSYYVIKWLVFWYLWHVFRIR